MNKKGKGLVSLEEITKRGEEAKKKQEKEREEREKQEAQQREEEKFKLLELRKNKTPAMLSLMLSKEVGGEVDPFNPPIMGKDVSIDNVYNLLRAMFITLHEYIQKEELSDDEFIYLNNMIMAARSDIMNLQLFDSGKHLEMVALYGEIFFSLVRWRQKKEEEGKSFDYIEGIILLPEEKRQYDNALAKGFVR